MTKKDFELIAAAIKGVDMPEDIRHFIAWQLAGSLRTLNANFDMRKFVLSCGVTGGVFTNSKE